MSTPTDTPPPASATTGKPARRCNGAFKCFPGSSRGRIQGLLQDHYPRLWGEVSVKWLPTARPIPDYQLQAHGDYARNTLSDVLIGLGEAGRAWDGFEVCETLKYVYGWQCDFHLAALVHAWSRDLSERLRTA